jgi:hypothetical protein
MSSARLLPTLLAALLVACAVACPPAGANADPASDYLIVEPWFRPFESPVSEEAAAELTRVLAAAKDAGMEVRVAVIATRADLGGVPILYEQPQRYADFLGSELVYLYKGLLLISMPNGLGLHQGQAKLAKEKALLAGLSVADTTDGTALVNAASDAVRALAQQRGLTLPGESTEGSRSKNRDRLTILVGAIVLGAAAFAVRRLRARRHGARVAT